MMLNDGVDDDSDDYSVTSFEWSDDEVEVRISKPRSDFIYDGKETDNEPVKVKGESFAAAQAISSCRDELFRFLSGLYKSAQYSDIVIHCRGGKIPGHRVVFASQLLMSILANDDIADIYLLDFDVSLVGTALQVLYTGNIVVSGKDLVTVKQILTLLGLLKFEVVELKETKKKKERQKLKVKHEKNLGSRRLPPELKVVPTRKKRIFMANLDPAELTCDICNKTFPALYKLKIHKLIHSSSFPFMCMKCGKGFNNKYKMHVHEKKKLCEMENQKPPKAQKPPKIVNINIYNCNECPMTFPYVKDLKKHVQLTHRVKEQLTCIHCNLICRSQKTFITHLKVVHNDHESGLKCTCSVCGKKFQKLSNLEDHILRHNEIKQFGCMYCPKRCATKQDLDRHLRSHSGEATFMCNFCSRTFVHRKTYTIHVRKHLGQKPYHCKPCNKGFAALTYLKKHQLSHQKKGDATKIVTSKKGNRGGTGLSYIDHFAAPEDALEAALMDSKLLEHSSSVYIPGPHYIQTGDSNVTPLGQMQVVTDTDLSEVSRLTYDNIKMSENINMYNKDMQHLQHGLYAKDVSNTTNVMFIKNNSVVEDPVSSMYITNNDDENSRDDGYLMGLFESQPSATETTLDKL